MKIHTAMTLLPWSHTAGTTVPDLHTMAWRGSGGVHYHGRGEALCPLPRAGEVPVKVARIFSVEFEC